MNFLSSFAAARKFAMKAPGPAHEFLVMHSSRKGFGRHIMDEPCLQQVVGLVAAALRGRPGTK